MPRHLVRPASLARQLNMAGAGVLSQAARDTLLALVDAQYSGGYGARDAAMALFAQARSVMAEVAGAAVDEVSFQPSVSAAVSLIAASMPLRPGDEVLSWSEEYPSNVRAWAAKARACGAQLKLADRGQIPDVSQLAECISSKTRVVTVSSIQSLDGAAADLASLRAACDRVGAYLLLDVSQHLGVAPFHFAQSGADYAYGVSHKWLLGPPGAAVLMARRDAAATLQTQVHGTGNYQGELGRHFDPEQALREDLGRLEGGTPPLMAALATAASARAIQTAGIDAIQAAALRVRDDILALMADSGGRCLGDASGRARSPIAAFEFSDEAVLTAWVKALESVGVQFITRGHVLRFSPWALSDAEREEACGYLAAAKAQVKSVQ